MSHNHQHDTDRSGKNHDQKGPQHRQTKAQDQRAKVESHEQRSNKPGDVGNANPADDRNDRQLLNNPVNIETMLDSSRPLTDEEADIRDGTKTPKDDESER